MVSRLLTFRGPTEPAMQRAARRHVAFLLSCALLILLFIITHQSRRPNDQSPLGRLDRPQYTPAFDWASRVGTYPVTSPFREVPLPQNRKLPRIQHDFGWFSGGAQKHRQQAVKETFQRCWTAYTKHAWLQDELRPVSNSSKDHFAGWAATLVDSLDTLWIMGLEDEFEAAVHAVGSTDFSVVMTESDGQISLFETTIRYLGGLLSAYDLSDDERLRVKAVELGHTLYGAFDTPNRMPVTLWHPSSVVKDASGGPPVQTQQVARSDAILADIGSLTLEFTRLSQVTGDNRWYDAVARIMEVFAAQQNMTNLSGMWPSIVDASTAIFYKGTEFTTGALSDSMYEYLLKMVVLLGGDAMYEEMYRKAADAIIEYILFRPMTTDGRDVLLAGKMQAFPDGRRSQLHDVEHLGCFLGGLIALDGRLLENETHIDIGRKLTDGCVWAYDVSPMGIMPEALTIVPCPTVPGSSSILDTTPCPWNATIWQQALVEHGDCGPTITSQALKLDTHLPRQQYSRNGLPPPLTFVLDPKYRLRPETIESLFVLYRITGEQSYREDAWRLFQRIESLTKTASANSAIANVMVLNEPLHLLDEIESFWLAETLKYFYLIFGNENGVSLDEWVFSTETHPFRQPRGKR